MMKTVSVCFVCLGNICRSPTAEAVLRHMVERAGLTDRVEIDSAGTGDWHVGDAPDARAQQAGRQRGYDLASLRARQIGIDDFARFDFIVAMDEANVSALREVCPPSARSKIHLLMDFAPESGTRVAAEIRIGDDAR